MNQGLSEYGNRLLAGSGTFSHDSPQGRAGALRFAQDAKIILEAAGSDDPNAVLEAHASELSQIALEVARSMV